MIAARFEPWAAGPLLADSANLITDQVVPLDDVWGADARRLEERIREAEGDEARLHLLIEHLQAVLLPSNSVGVALRFALQLIAETHGHISVEELARQVQWSRRRLERHFVAAVGLPPKLLCRIERFQHVVRAVGENHRPRLVDLALAAGYSDQAHLAREFRELAGLSVTAYLAEQHAVSDAFTQQDGQDGQAP
jgi:AraC-like DNA-binding protein